jgi:hypothetical protein
VIESLVKEGYIIPGSSNPLTSKIPLNISSHFPFSPRSSRETKLKLNSPFSAAFLAKARSRAFAAKISSFASESVAWIAVRALSLELVGSVANTREADFAAEAASAGRAFVTDIEDTN